VPDDFVHKELTDALMSMYTQLLGAALGERFPHDAGVSRHAAVAEARRCRHDLATGTPVGVNPDSVPVVLALQVGYDVALIELASVMGIDSDPGRFEQPQRERERLEAALGDLGISLEAKGGAEASSSLA
jgi:hypothetical protein